MTPEQDAHLESIKAGFCKDITAKYSAGQQQHGGNLWAKPGVFRMLTEETLDFIVYARTLEQQLREVLSHIEHGEPQAAWRKLHGILDGPAD